MVNELAAIENIIQEHEAINGHMRSISILLEEWKEMDVNKLADLNHEQLQTLKNRSFSFKQTMNYLDEGMKKHWVLEDQVLPELIGKPLAKSLHIEHVEIMKQMNEIKSAVFNIELRDFLLKRAYLKNSISYLSQYIREHEAKENTILQLLKKQFV